MALKAITKIRVENARRLNSIDSRKIGVSYSLWSWDAPGGLNVDGVDKVGRGGYCGFRRVCRLEGCFDDISRLDVGNILVDGAEQDVERKLGEAALGSGT